MASKQRSGHRTPFGLPVVPEVNRTINGSAPVSRTGSQVLGCAASSAAKAPGSGLPRSTIRTGGQFSTSSSLGRLAASVTISFAWLPPTDVTRLVTAAGPNAVNKG